VELLREVYAGAFCFNHLNDGGEMACARLRRLIIPGWLACSIPLSYPPGEDTATRRGHDVMRQIRHA
jgi:hypothetical protein